MCCSLVIFQQLAKFVSHCREKTKPRVLKKSQSSKTEGVAESVYPTRVCVCVCQMCLSFFPLYLLAFSFVSLSLPLVVKVQTFDFLYVIEKQVACISSIMDVLSLTPIQKSC